MCSLDLSSLKQTDDQLSALRTTSDSLIVLLLTEYSECIRKMNIFVFTHNLRAVVFFLILLEVMLAKNNKTFSLSLYFIFSILFSNSMRSFSPSLLGNIDLAIDEAQYIFWSKV